MAFSLEYLSQHTKEREVELEGGEPALKLLREYDGLWLWRIEIEKTGRPE